jgi:hypothetical protein
MAKQIIDSSSTPTHEQIAARAYEIFVERGQPQGRDLDHWLEAEAQLCAAGRASDSAPANAASSNGRSQSVPRNQPRLRR